MIISMHSRKIEVNRFNHQLHWMHKNFLFFFYCFGFCCKMKDIH